MIKFLDFEPRQLAAPGFLKEARYESLTDVMVDVNKMAADERIEIINIETVVLPNMHDHGEEGTTDPSIRTSGDFMSTWHQFIRVWYRDS